LGGLLADVLFGVAEDALEVSDNSVVLIFVRYKLRKNISYLIPLLATDSHYTALNIRKHLSTYGNIRLYCVGERIMMMNMYTVVFTNGCRVRTYADDAKISEIIENLRTNYAKYYKVNLDVSTVIPEK
jgi:hypothetical protein